MATDNRYDGSYTVRVRRVTVFTGRPEPPKTPATEVMPRRAETEPSRTSFSLS